jgi:hypothetical protein
MIAIASNAMGDHVLLHLDSGDVYIWDHEGEEFENPRRMTNVYPQGTGFDELLAELSVYE